MKHTKQIFDGTRESWFAYIGEEEARADSVDFPHGTSALRVPVDRDHDVPGLFCVSRDCDRVYVDRALPRTVWIGSAVVDPAVVGWEAERARWLHTMKLIGGVLDAFNRHPSEAERSEIDRWAAAAAVDAEKAAVERLGLIWDEWAAWVRDQEVAASGRDMTRRPALAFVRNIALNPENEPLWQEVRRRDRLGYLEGLKLLRAVPDHDRWHAQYDPDNDAITVESKFGRAGDAEKLHVLLHEVGHRGQEVDPETYAAFKERHLNQLSAFLDMANPTHLHDFEEKGKVEGLASEVFAESYARFMLGLPMPERLRLFWSEREALECSDAVV